jgi:hypothetical protein
MVDRVRVSLGRTVNLGNFESYRVDVDLQSAVLDGETVTAAYDRVKKIVEKRLDAECAPVEQGLSDYKTRREKK